MSKEEGNRRNGANPWEQANRGYHQDDKEAMKLWGIVVFGFIGATVTTFALSRSQSTWKDRRFFRISFQEEAWKRYNRRMQEEYEEEMERVERIRRMQSVFNRERDKFKRSYESWQEYGPGAYHQHFQRNDWYWKADASFREQSNNYTEMPRANTNAPLSHHYSVLGLDRRRIEPYIDEEIKSAFRTKAKELHPDQNQDNKEYAEAKFKEVMVSYEAIKSERKNTSAIRRP